MEVRRILVATDFSDASTKAFDQSVALARGRDVEIHVIHRLASPIPAFPPVAHPGVSTWAEMGPMLDEFNAQLRLEAEKQIDALRERMPAGISVEVSIEESLDTVEAVLEKIQLWKPDLLAVGTRGREGLEKLVMGSIATKLLHHAEIPTMMVRADSELFGVAHRVGPIVVPVDFSDYSHRALALARVLASRHETSVNLLHAEELLHTPLQPGGLTSRFDAQPGLREKYVAAMKDMLGETEGDVAAVDGSPAQAILSWREKWEASLVVMGSRGLSGLPHLLVGSVAEKVARFCEVPVIIVK